MFLSLEDIFPTEERVRIFNEIIYLEREFGVSEIAHKTSLSKGLVSRYFEILVNEKILSKRRTKFVVGDNAKVRALRIAINIAKIDSRIFNRYDCVRAAGLYGSCAKGTNTESSDVDIWVKVEGGSELALAEMVSEITRKIDKVKVLILNDEKIAHLKKTDNLFYNALYFGSIILYGADNEI